MTYRDLYFAATTWTAGHVAQDLMNNYGKNNKVDQHDIDQVNHWQAKEGGKLIPPVVERTSSVDSLIESPGYDSIDMAQLFQVADKASTVVMASRDHLSGRLEIGDQHAWDTLSIAITGLIFVMDYTCSLRECE